MSPTLRQGTLEMQFGLFELQFVYGWLWAKKSSFAELPLNLT
jgi:hypothetical protein